MSYLLSRTVHVGRLQRRRMLSLEVGALLLHVAFKLGKFELKTGLHSADGKGLDGLHI